MKPQFQSLVGLLPVGINLYETRKNLVVEFNFPLTQKEWRGSLSAHELVIEGLGGELIKLRNNLDPQITTEENLVISLPCLVNPEDWSLEHRGGQFRFVLRKSSIEKQGVKKMVIIS